MSSLHLKESDIPDLTGQVAIVTGGASGIGLAASRILANHGATVHVLDISAPHPADGPSPASVHSHLCNVASWKDLTAAFQRIGHVDIAVANAGVSEECDYFADTFDEDGKLEEPKYDVIKVNLRAVFNFVKLSLSAFKRQGPGGSIVITSSATGYSPEQSLPVYSATKGGLLGLVRALRSTIPHTHGATINIVAPAATVTRLLPPELAAPIMAAGAPVSSAEHVGLAIAYSATATQANQVEGYGRDTPDGIQAEGRWNGRAILTLGDTWTEIEEPLAKLRPQWLGIYQTEKTAWQQALTDMRPHVYRPPESQAEESQKSPLEKMELVENDTHKIGRD
ncbi:MAG: hypothetical protein M1816_007298 [Peltula sp. TS41687]|nr:MAG: hypothetical protein M1816_007298 [Peltula sp. TS41687]